MASGKNKKFTGETRLRRHNAEQRSSLPGIKRLTEAIILQSLEDFWSPYYRDESIEFFTKEGFDICSEIAGLDTASQLQIIDLLGGNNHARTT